MVILDKDGLERFYWYINNILNLSVILKIIIYYIFIFPYEVEKRAFIITFTIKYILSCI
mgnify:CR=1 FL=1